MGLFNSGENHQAVVTKWNTLGNVQLEAVEVLTFIGKGVGATKTTTVIDNTTIAEQFGINDEIYEQWHMPLNLDRTVPVEIHLGWYLNASEVGTTVSWDIDLLPMDQNNGTLITDPTTKLQIVDHAQVETAYQGNDEFVTLDTSLVHSNITHYQLRIKRVASTSDSTADPRLEHIHIRYTRAWV